MRMIGRVLRSEEEPRISRKMYTYTQIAFALMGKYVTVSRLR